MKEQNIRKAFDPVVLTQEEKNALLQNILSASGHQPAERKRTMNYKKTLLIAAIITAMAVFMGCAIAALSTKDLKLDEYQATAPAWIDAEGQRHAAQAVTKTVLSLQGFRDTPEQQAALEWYQFRKDYDPNGDIYLASKNSFQAPEEYAAYDVYSQEMVDKLDEIARKYGLKLAGRKATVYDYDWELGWNAVGIQAPLIRDAEERKDLRLCTFYECGNCDFSVDFHTTDSAYTWENPSNIVLSYAKKGYMNTNFFVADNASNAREWVYTRSDGLKILVAVAVSAEHSNNFGYLICDREDAFLSARFVPEYCLNAGDGPWEKMSDRDIEWLAEHIDFSIQPKKPDMDKVLPLIQRADAEYDAMLNQDDPFRQDSYDQLRKVSGATEYCLLDLNGDGQEECIFWKNGENPSLYTMRDDKTTFVGLREKDMVGISGEVKLYEGNVLGTYQEVGEAYRLYTFYTMEDASLVVQQCVVYDAANDAWGLSLGDTKIIKTISEAEARKTLDAYREIPMERKPVEQLAEE